jgi:hypothetical protein
MLDLSSCAWMGDHGPVHLDCCGYHINLGTFPSEMGAVVGDDGVADPEVENNILDKIYCLLGANFS